MTYRIAGNKKQQQKRSARQRAARKLKGLMLTEEQTIHINKIINEAINDSQQ